MIRPPRFLLPALLALATGGTAMADPPVAPASAAPTTAQATDVAPTVAKPAPGDKVICKYEVPTGSRLAGHKTCMKKSDWDAQAAAAQAAMSSRIGSGTNTH